MQSKENYTDHTYKIEVLTQGLSQVFYYNGEAYLAIWGNFSNAQQNIYYLAVIEDFTQIKIYVVKIYFIRAIDLIVEHQKLKLCVHVVHY